MVVVGVAAKPLTMARGAIASVKECSRSIVLGGASGSGINYLMYVNSYVGLESGFYANTPCKRR